MRSPHLLLPKFTEVIQFVDDFLIEKENEGDFYSKGIEKLPELWKGCIEAGGKYFYKI